MIRFIQPACYTSIVKKTNFDQEYCTIICNTELQEIFLLFSRFLNYRRLIIKSGYKFFKETFFKWLEKQLQYILSRFCFSIIYKIKWLSLLNSSVKYLQHEQFHQPASKNTFIYWWLFLCSVIEIWKQITYWYNLWLIHSSFQNICVIFVCWSICTLDLCL